MLLVVVHEKGLRIIQFTKQCVEKIKLVGMCLGGMRLGCLWTFLPLG